MKYIVRESFGGKKICESTEIEEVLSIAKDHSFNYPVDVWSTSDGYFKMGQIIAHFNNGVRS